MPNVVSQNQTRPATGAPARAYNPGPAAHPQVAGLEAAPIARQMQFYVEFRSDMDGQVYSGQFTAKRLSVRDVAQIGVRKVQLNGGYHYDAKNPGYGIDQQTDALNTMIAHLEIALIQAPIWWNVNEVSDDDLLIEVFKRVIEIENSFFRPNGDANRHTGSGQNVGSGQGENSGSVGSVEMVGGREVQAALEP